MGTLSFKFSDLCELVHDSVKINLNMQLKEWRLIKVATSDGWGSLRGGWGKLLIRRAARGASQSDLC